MVDNQLNSTFDNRYSLQSRLEFWPFSGPFRVQMIIFSFRKIFSQYSVPEIPIEPEILGTQSTRLRPQFHTESLIGKLKILKRQTHGITTKAYRSV